MLGNGGRRVILTASPFFCTEYDRGTCCRLRTAAAAHTTRYYTAAVCTSSVYSGVYIYTVYFEVCDINTWYRYVVRVVSVLYAKH